MACARAVQAAPPDSADSRSTPETKGPDDDVPGGPRPRPASAPRLRSAPRIDLRGPDVGRPPQRHDPRFHRDLGLRVGRGRDHVVERADGQRLRPHEGPRDRRHHLVPHLVDHPAAAPRRSVGRRPRHRVREGRLLHQVRRLQLLRVVHAARRTRRSAREARAPAGEAARRGSLRRPTEEAAPVPPPRHRPDHRREVRRREGRPAQRRAALAACPVPHGLRLRAGRPLRPRDDRGAQGAGCRPECGCDRHRPGRRRPAAPAGLQRRTTAAGGGRGIHSRRQRDRPRERPSASGRCRGPPRLDSDRRREARRARRGGAAFA